MSIVLILGPYGSGKSTLVRRLMKPRAWTKRFRTGHLPESYHSKDLVVFGNYEDTSRTRHGMGHLDRDPLAHELAMRHAVEESRRLPVVMEGGFSRFERLKSAHGQRFANETTAILLDVVGEPKDRLGRKLTDNGCVSFAVTQLKAATIIADLGGVREIIADREEALRRVCELLKISVPTDQVDIDDYR